MDSSLISTIYLISIIFILSLVFLLFIFFNVFLYLAGFCRTQAYCDQRLICCRIDTDLSNKTVESQFIFFSEYEGLLHCRHLVFWALKAADP